MNLQPGARLGPYEVKDRLGSGGMGEVYRATDTRLDREVAIKVLPANHAANQARRERLVAEAKAAAALSHPNVCTLYEVGEHEGRPFIAMERVPGRTLRELLPRRGFVTEHVVGYGLQIADALAYAHDHGVVHRDLKASNVMVTPEGRVKIVDFGLARRLDQVDLDELTRSNESLTSHEAIAGTLAYMAPEVLAGDPAREACDIWALGVLLYLMTSGRLPFSGRTAFELTASILRESPRSLPVESLPSLASIVRRCLAKEPSHRYRRAGEVHAALESAYQDVTLTGGASSPSPSGGLDETTVDYLPHRAADEPAAINDSGSTSSIEIETLDRIVGTLAPIVTAAKVLAGVSTVVLVLGLLGLVTSATFDLALRVPHREALLDYLVLGARAVIPAGVLALVIIAAIAASAAGLKLATSLLGNLSSSAAPQRQPGIVARMRAGFEAFNPVKTVAALMVLSLGVVAILVAASWPQIRTIEKLVEQPLARAVDTSALSPARHDDHFRVSWIAAASFASLAAAWILGLGQVRRQSLGGFSLTLLRAAGVVTGLAVLVLTAAPWKLVWNAERERLVFDGKRAYAVAERDSRLFLYVPDGSPRSIEVPADDGRIRRTPSPVRESVFTAEPPIDARDPGPPASRGPQHGTDAAPEQSEEAVKR